jgi:hypothetical protein
MPNLASAPQLQSGVTNASGVLARRRLPRQRSGDADVDWIEADCSPLHPDLRAAFGTSRGYCDWRFRPAHRGRGGSLLQSRPAAGPGSLHRFSELRRHLAARANFRPRWASSRPIPAMAPALRQSTCVTKRATPRVVATSGSRNAGACSETFLCGKSMFFNQVPRA